MYVLVRADLSETYRIVQGSHALAQYALDFPEQFKIWGNSTIVFLKVRNLLELKAWHAKVSESGKIHRSFHEPDLEGQLTAIACYDDGIIFKELKTA
jgi:hypothetical protein